MQDNTITLLSYGSATKGVHGWRGGSIHWYGWYFRLCSCLQVAQTCTNPTSLSQIKQQQWREVGKEENQHGISYRSTKSQTSPNFKTLSNSFRVVIPVKRLIVEISEWTQIRKISTIPQIFNLPCIITFIVSDCLFLGSVLYRTTNIYLHTE